jgi:hypothetical protein
MSCFTENGRLSLKRNGRLKLQDIFPPRFCGDTLMRDVPNRDNEVSSQKKGGQTCGCGVVALFPRPEDLAQMRGRCGDQDVAVHPRWE